MNNSELANKQGFVEVIFTSGTTTNMVAPSPTRKISGYYAFAADGAKIWVHEDDQRVRPDLYKLVEVVKEVSFSVPTQPVKRGRKPRIGG